MSSAPEREPRRSPIRDRLASILACAGAITLIGAGLALYARSEVLDPERFAERSTAALDDPELREAIGRTLAVEVNRISPETLSARPVIESALASFAGTELFRSAFRSAVEHAHAALISDAAEPVVLTLEDASTVIRTAIVGIDPRVAEELPDQIAPQLTRIRSSEAARELARSAERLETLATILPPAGGVLLLLALLAAFRRRTVVFVGASLVLSSIAAAAALILAERSVVHDAGRSDALSAEAARAAVDAIWSAMFADLERGLTLAAGAGLVLALLAASLAGGPLAAPGTRWRVLAGRTSAPAGRILRGGALVLLGALVAIDPGVGLPIAAALAGGLALTAGVWEIGAGARARRRAGARAGAPLPPSSALTRRRALALAALAALSASAGAAIALLVSGESGPSEPASGPIPPDRIALCNGLAINCDRGLGEVVFPGTHNSMSAAEDPGWFFANQRFDIGRQLADGIRLLMIDPHWGIADEDGNIRTDLEAEGVDRNRVARALGDEAIAAAERLIGEIGLGDLEGEPRPYLCHTLCELGATELTAALSEVRAFLDRERYEVLVILVEPSIPAEPVAEAFGDAGLVPYAATLDRSEPLPDLRELIAANRRLVVLTTRDGGEPGWYMDLLSFVRDTVVGADPDTCEPRSGSGTAPMFLINDWVDEFPPPRAGNAELGSAGEIAEKASTCLEELGRAPNLIAVDHYDAGGIVAAADSLNGGG